MTGFTDLSNEPADDIRVALINFTSGEVVFCKALDPDPLAVVNVRGKFPVFVDVVSVSETGVDRAREANSELAVLGGCIDLIGMIFTGKFTFGRTSGEPGVDEREAILTDILDLVGVGLDPSIALRESF